MRKKILGGFAVLGIAAMAAWNVNFGTNSYNLSDISLENVEALAYEHDYYTDRSDDYNSEKKCYKQCVNDGDSCVYTYDFPYNC